MASDAALATHVKKVMVSKGRVRRLAPTRTEAEPPCLIVVPFGRLPTIAGFMGHMTGSD